VISATSCGSTQWTRERTSGDPKRVLRGGGTLRGDVSIGGKSAHRHPRAVDVIEAWTKANGYDAGIWTALETNFHKADKAGEPFSVLAALRYLDSNQKLDATQRTSAFVYIRSAPSSVGTPVRDAAAAKWWPYVT
jgi:hypothetical protein